MVRDKKNKKDESNDKKKGGGFGTGTSIGGQKNDCQNDLFNYVNLRNNSGYHYGHRI